MFFNDFRTMQHSKSAPVVRTVRSPGQLPILPLSDVQNADPARSSEDLVREMVFKESRSELLEIANKLAENPSDTELFPIVDRLVAVSNELLKLLRSTAVL
jgi:hypothetical protein